MTLPTVSIITPSYNQGRYLAQAVESVLRQDYPRIEYLVVDGGSTDETLEILRSYGDRVRWISEPDRGQSDAINKGMRVATGEIVTWLCSDDVYTPGAVRRAVEVFAREPSAAVVYGDADYIGPTGERLLRFRGKPFDLKEVLTTCCNPVSQAASFIRATVWRDVGGVREDLPALMDFDLWLRSARKARLHYVPEVWAAARIHPSSKTVRAGTTNAEMLVKIVSDFFALEDISEDLRTIRTRAFASAHLVAGMECYQARAMREARTHFRTALRLDPAAWTAKATSLYLRSLLGPRVVGFLRKLRGRLGDPIRRATDGDW